MLWALLAFLTALCESMKDVASKKSLSLAGIDEYTLAWSIRVFALPFLLPLLFITEMPPLGKDFAFALLVGGGLNVVATVLYMRAIKDSDLSITVPMVTFTPLFLLITSPLIVAEFPSAFGIIGIFLIVLGSYILNIQNKGKGGGLLSPFRSLLKEKGPRLMLGVAFIWSITANFDKVGVLNSSPIFWIISVNIFVMSVMFPLMCLKSGNGARQIPRNIKALLPVGLFSAMTLTFQMTAITMTLVVYLISIKRTSAIMSVIFGALLFKEKNLKGRLTGAVIMVAGVLLITLL